MLPSIVLATLLLAAQAEEAAAPRVSRLQGKVYLGRNRDVTGAVVRVRNEGDPGRVWLTSTDAKGVFRIEGLADGSYDVRVEREGLEPVEKGAIGVRFPFRAVVELVMKHTETQAQLQASAATVAPSSAGVRLSGTVRDVALDGVAEARVRIVDPSGRTDPRIFTTGADGTFAFDDLPGGDWAVHVRGVGRLPIRVRLALSADTSLDVILVQQPAAYVPSPLELMPPEEPVVPEGFRPESQAAEAPPEPGSEVRTAK